MPHKENINTHSKVELEYGQIDNLIELLCSFRSFIKEDDFTLVNFNAYLSAVDKKQFEHLYRTTYTASSEQASPEPSIVQTFKILQTASADDANLFDEYIKFNDESTSDVVAKMTEIHEKYLKNNDFVIFINEVFDTFKNYHSHQIKALLILREKVDKDIFDKIIIAPQVLKDAIEKSESQKDPVIHHSEFSKESNQPLQDVSAEETMGTKAKAQAEVAADTTTAVAVTANGTLASSAIPLTDSDAGPSSYFMPLLIAAVSVGTVAQAWHQGRLTADMVDAPLADIVAAVIGFDPFH